MHYVEKQPATISFNTVKFSGMITGTDESVTFESDDEAFLEYFPEGRFDSLFVDEKKLTQAQADIIETARELIRLKLRH